MPSGLFVALEQRLKELAACFIVEKADYDAYTRADHDMALAYVLLASAAIENYVEQRCLQVAKTGCERFSKGQPTTTGRAVLEWFILLQGFRGSNYATVPVDDADLQKAKSLLPDAASAFSKEVKKIHGIKGADFQRLVRPVGLRDEQFAPMLIDLLDALASQRDTASHGLVKRAKTLRDPAAERAQVEQIVTELQEVDAALEHVMTVYPI